MLFSNEDDANLALQKHRESIGTRYIELFKSTTAEVQQVLNRSMDPRSPSTDLLEANSLPPLLPQIPHSPIPGMLLPQQVISSSPQRDCIRLRGLPFEATVTDILTFLGEYSRNIVFQGVHMVYTSQGTPSGEAFIQMDSEHSAETATLLKHRKFMFINNKKRYIEVLQCSGEDMNLVLTSGLPPMGVPVSNASVPQMLPTMMPMPQTAIPAATVLPKQLAMSPGGQVLPQSLTPTGNGATAAYPAPASMYPYAPQSAPLMTTPMSLPGPTMLSGSIPQHTALSALSLPAQRPQTANYSSAYQPILYWYPSPPVSPQSTYYVQTCPTTVVVKGLPFHAQAGDVLAIFEGIYEMQQPDVQLQRTADGRLTGDAFVTFGSRAEAERAVTERNRKLVGNRLVEVHMA